MKGKTMPEKDSLKESIIILNELLDKIDADKIPSAEEQLKNI